MDRQRTGSGAPWEDRYGYSRAVKAGNFVAVSGTVGRYADGSVPAGAYEQAREALRIIIDALAHLGVSPEDVVRTRTFVTDLSIFADVARAHAEVFGTIKPATSLLQVTALIEPVYLLEIEADAIVD
jgi:enamine deaminase RidA (YjgF/YER057c/UK114 family)